MIDFNVIRLALQEWLVRSSGLPDNKIVFSDQADVSPAKPYITLKITSVVDIGQDDSRSSIDSLGKATFTGNREFTLSIQLFGADALTTLSRVRDSFNNPEELDRLRSDCLVFVDQLLLSDITDLLETIWEERGQLDILFRTTSVSKYTVGYISKVKLLGSYSDSSGNVTHEHNFNVVAPLEVDNLNVITTIDTPTIQIL